MQALKRLFRAVYYLALLTLFVGAAIGAAYVGGYVPKDIREVRIEIPIEAPESDIVTQIKEVCPTYGVPWQLGVAVYMHESNDGRWLYRFEPNQMSRASKLASYPEEVRALASSHGPMHVMGITAKQVYGVHWSKLYGREGIEVGCAYLGKGLESAKGKPFAERVRSALVYYNGGSDYPPKVLAKLGELVLQEMGDQFENAESNVSSRRDRALEQAPAHGMGRSVGARANNGSRRSASRDRIREGREAESIEMQAIGIEADQGGYG